MEEYLTEIKEAVKEGGFKEISSGVRDENQEKEKKAAISKEYFDIANNEIPGLLAPGFVKAMKKYDSEQSGEICCILDIDSEPSRMVFVYGDGLGCEGADDESVFFVYPCGDTLKKCKQMIGAIDTLNAGQESGHWLTDALGLAKDEGAFGDVSVTIYGDVQYGDYELDVIYES
jgi:hypothetical protein